MLDSEDNSLSLFVFEGLHVLKQLIGLFLATVPPSEFTACSVCVRLTFASPLLLIQLHTDLFLQKEQRQKRYTAQHRLSEEDFDVYFALDKCLTKV